MKRIPFDQHQTGDIFLAAVPGGLHNDIWFAEWQIHPDAPNDFEPTHAGIFGFNDTVVEAWLDIMKHEDSVACVLPMSKYAGLEQYLEVWRPASFVATELLTYIREYGPENYGALNLLGFEWVAVVKWLTGRQVDNPIECSQVCSQGVGDYLTLQAKEGVADVEWIYPVKIRNLDPLALRMLLLAHEA